MLHRAVDEIPLSNDVQPTIKKWFMAANWMEVYNFIQYMLSQHNFYRGQNDKRKDADKALNYHLEREMSGYRAVNEQLVPITSPTEIAEIEQAATPSTRFADASEHINAALAFLETPNTS